MSLPTSRIELIQELNNYKSTFAEENTFRDSFLTLLQHPNAYQREHLPGHITCSAWICNRERNKILLLHHQKLNRWLQPGGHADGDESLLAVALKEVQEETGLENLTLIIPGLFDIDIHPIPESKQMPGHFHYDLRLCFEANEHDPLHKNHESKNLAWVGLNEIPAICAQEKSILRMLGKMSS